MNHVSAIRSHLLHELEHGVATTRRLLELIKPEQWDYRPRDNMRSLLEVAHHLVTIPGSDLAIMQEKGMDDVKRVEAEVSGIRDPLQLAAVMERLYGEMKTYFESLPDDEFVSRETKAFYAERPAAQARWLIETTTHVYHHRSQLYSYMKQLGHDIQFFILY
ncbi:DinB family protein [Paenibacillus flagellatus]|uniref:Damage-inducible protein DinB n=1 Tax=Paenibacillus flagellatus TaxID=2211139 RepID=A0A2V5K155_9BACL|nr:DinB family protein [Paenibacillus flagellatus]PYI52869.1 damage-inducible protein DinB [Paenibacillus flagellatus]